jgi:hypothetical protein
MENQRGRSREPGRIRIFWTVAIAHQGPKLIRRLCRRTNLLASTSTSRILEDLEECRGLVEPREGIGYGSYEGAKAGRRVVLI